MRGNPFGLTVTSVLFMTVPTVGCPGGGRWPADAGDAVGCQLGGQNACE